MARLKVSVRLVGPQGSGKTTAALAIIEALKPLGFEVVGADLDCCPMRKREEAIAEGRAEYDGLEFWVQCGRRPGPEEFMPDADDIIEIAGNNACDNAGEAGEEWPDVSKEGKAELDALLVAWASKHCPVRFWIADGDAERVPAVGESETT